MCTVKTMLPFPDLRLGVAPGDHYAVGEISPGTVASVAPEKNFGFGYSVQGWGRWATDGRNIHSTARILPLASIHVGSHFIVNGHLKDVFKTVPALQCRYFPSEYF